MYIRIGYEFCFELPRPTHMLLMLHTHPERAGQLQRPERIYVDPDTRLDTFTDLYGNRVSRIMAPAGKLRIWSDNVIWDSGEREQGIEGLKLHAVDELPNDTLPFLLESRYCEVDRVGPMAWDLFGKIAPTWERVAAVLDWVHTNIEFGYKFARFNKTAWDTFYERKGVCRDFQHLAITILRALNIPARYATGYLGDIDVAPDGLPDDFSAWIEVFLGGKWVTLDARHNVPRVGRVLMARGSDATDVAMTTSFGAAKLERFRVWTDEVGPEAIEQPDTIFVPNAVVTTPAMVPMVG